MMHSSEIVAIDLTRGHAVHLATGLRFGNFEGANHLPPVTSGHHLSPQSFASLNNQQIYRTVCSWLQSWQPWQQKVLLCSVVNRLCLPQLHSLVTVLEPLRHRDPLKALHQKMSSSPVLDIPTSKASLSSEQPALKLPHISSSGKGESENDACSCGHDALTEKDQNMKSRQEEKVKISDASKVDNSCCSGEVRENTDEKAEETTRPGVVDLEMYASVVSSSVLVAAFGEMALAEKMEDIMKQEFTKPKSAAVITNGGRISDEVSLLNMDHAFHESRRINNLSFTALAAENNAANSQHLLTPNLVSCSDKLQPSCASGISRLQEASAHFLTSQISFSRGQSHRSGITRSKSSHYRYSAFSASGASTSDFFLRDKIPILGPMFRSVTRKPVAQGNIPVPIQRFYKNRAWWPCDPSRYVSLHPAKKQELSNNFRDQLSAINEWLGQWETYERLLLLNEVVKLSSGELLTELLAYIHQKLDTAFNINCLPDKLLLYILSFLSPSDLLRAAQVCRRWRYLSAFDDVWIVKCLEFGEDEGIENMPQLIMSANSGGKSVDWQLAYVELRRLVGTLRKTNTQSSISDAGILLKASESDTGTDLGITDSLSGEKTCDRGSTAKDLPPMVHDPVDLKCPQVSVSTDPLSKLSHRHHVSLKSSQKTKREVSRRENSGRSSADAAIARCKQKDARFKVQESKDVEETALDILTDLSQSTDLLGKIQPSRTLEWKTPQHDEDLLRFPVYAGKVAIVQKVHKITGHIGAINCLQFDQRRLLTGGSDRTVRLWDIRSGRPVHRFYGHKGGVRCLQFDDDILVTGAWDTVIFVWNIRKFTRTAILHGHEDSVSCLKLLSHILVSGSHDHTVRLWSRDTHDCMMVLRGHSGPVLSLETDGTFVYSSSADMTVRMTELHSGVCKRVFERSNTSPINCLKLHGRLLLGGEAEGKVCFWNTVTGEAEAAVRAHDVAVNAIDYRQGRFYTGSSDGTISEYDLMTMTCLRVLRGHTGAVRAIQVSERRFVSSSDDGSVRIWDFHTSTGSHQNSSAR